MMRLLERFLILFVLISVCGVASARVYLVSAGVCDYSHFPGGANSLRLPVKDAKDVASLYSGKASAKYTLLVNSQATRNNILRTMKQIYSQAGPDDAIVFYFSGHGYAGG